MKSDNDATQMIQTVVENGHQTLNKRGQMYVHEHMCKESDSDKNFPLSFLTFLLFFSI